MMFVPDGCLVHKKDPVHNRYTICHFEACHAWISETKENPGAVDFQGFRVCGISRTRTYDPHDVNVVL